jgi:hypothetical protein
MIAAGAPAYVALHDRERKRKPVLLGPLAQSELRQLLAGVALSTRNRAEHEDHHVADTSAMKRSLVFGLQHETFTSSTFTSVTTCSRSRLFKGSYLDFVVERFAGCQQHKNCGAAGIAKRFDTFRIVELRRRVFCPGLQDPWHNPVMNVAIVYRVNGRVGSESRSAQRGQYSYCTLTAKVWATPQTPGRAQRKPILWETNSNAHRPMRQRDAAADLTRIRSLAQKPKKWRRRIA